MMRRRDEEDEEVMVLEAAKKTPPSKSSAGGGSSSSSAAPAAAVEDDDEEEEEEGRQGEYVDKRGLIRSDNRRDHYNPTGFKGVRKMDSGRFEARYQTYEKGKHTFQYLGTYETLLEAAQTYARKWRKERGFADGGG